MAFLGGLAALLVAFLFGFITSIPPAGPIAALMIQHSAKGEHRRALRIGMGAALVECLFAGTAAGALWVVSGRVALLHQIGFMVASLLFPVVGLRLIFWKASPAAEGRGAPHAGVRLGATIAALNPAPLVGWGTVVTLLHSGHFIVDGALIPLFGLAGGAGVASWNLLLISLLKRHLGRLPPAFLATFVRGVGCLLVGIGLWSALTLLRQAMLRS